MSGDLSSHADLQDVDMCHGILNQAVLENSNLRNAQLRCDDGHSATISRKHIGDVMGDGTNIT